MTVFVSRFRQSYVRRRTMGEMLLFTLIVVVCAALSSLAVSDVDERVDRYSRALSAGNVVIVSVDGAPLLVKVTPVGQ